MFLRIRRYWPLGISQRLSSEVIHSSSEAIVLLSISVFSREHCHTTAMRQPKFISSVIFRASRSRFAFRFSSQKACLVVGRRLFLQPGWPCQKQPCIKMVALYLGRTMSGLPGSPATYFRKRYPFSWRYDRTFFSMAVSLPWTLAISWLRCSGDRVSVI